MMGNRNAPNPTQRAPQKHSQRVVSPRHTGRGEGTYSAPEITTGDAVLHGQAVLTVGDGSPVGNREDARGRREDGKKLRKTQTTISRSLFTTTCGPAGSPASAFTRQGAHCTAAVDRAISVNRQRLRRGCRHHRRPRARRGMTTTGCPCVQFHAIHPVLCAWRRRSGGPRTLLAAPTGGAQCPRCKPMRRTGAADRGSRSRSASHTRHVLLSSQVTRPPVSMPRTPPPPAPPTWNIVSLNALEIDEGEKDQGSGVDSCAPLPLSGF